MRRNRCRILAIIERLHGRQFEAAAARLGHGVERWRTRRLAGLRPRSSHERAFGAARGQRRNGGACWQVGFARSILRVLANAPIYLAGNDRMEQFHFRSLRLSAT